MKDESKKVLSKDQLKSKLDELGDEIKYRVEEAKKSGASIGGAHKTDIGELMKDYRIMKEAYGRILNTEKESLQLEDILSTLAEEKEEDSKKVKEREEIQVSRIDSFGEYRVDKDGTKIYAEKKLDSNLDANVTSEEQKKLLISSRNTIVPPSSVSSL